jgi:hypothetical protein
MRPHGTSNAAPHPAGCHPSGAELKTKKPRQAARPAGVEFPAIGPERQRHPPGAYEDELDEEKVGIKGLRSTDTRLGGSFGNVFIDPPAGGRGQDQAIALAPVASVFFRWRRSCVESRRFISFSDTRLRSTPPSSSSRTKASTAFFWECEAVATRAAAMRVIGTLSAERASPDARELLAGRRTMVEGRIPAAGGSPCHVGRHILASSARAVEG